MGAHGGVALKSVSRSWVMFLAVVLVAAAVYWPGLSGPFLLDDEPNLGPVRDWLAGSTHWREVVLSNRAGLMGRAVSMGSFLASAAAWGYSPWSFKLGNLLLHLLTGILVFALFRGISYRDSGLRRLAVVVPLVLATAWLLHPLLVSTVLYAVQRMAMLSAFLTLAAILAYWHGRLALESGRQRRGWLLLFGALPALTLLAALSKENGALAPILCGVLEWVYFRPAPGHKRPLAARLFIWLGCVAPSATAILAFAARSERFLGGYANREFSLVERLLTQSRVLFDYIGSILLPWGPGLSLYRDDYPISTGLLSPTTTLLAIVGWAALLVAAITLRSRIPAFTAGVFLFLVGHLMESTVLPLLLYFEHRNYLPAIGILLAAAGVLVHAGQHLAPRMNSPRLVFGGAAVIYCMVLAVATHARVLVWQDHAALLASSLATNPDSRWLRMEIAKVAMAQSPPQIATAREHYEVLSLRARQLDRETGFIGLSSLDCYEDGRLSPASSNALLRDTVTVIEPDISAAIDSLSQSILERPCEGLSPGEMATRLASWLDRSPVSESVRPKWRARFQASKLFLSTGEHDRQALEQANIAWRTGVAEDPVGALIILLHLRLGNTVEADELLSELELRIPASHREGRALLASYRQILDAIRRRDQSPYDPPAD